MSLKNCFDFVDEIWCINLDHRTDRWNYAQKEFDRIGIKDRVQRFSAIKHENGKFGLVQSFLSLIKYAKEKNLKNILIFEDDITFSPTEELEKVLPCAVEQLKLHDDWEMVFFGAMLIGHVKYVEKNLIKLTNGLCAHAICYRNNVFSSLIEQLSVLDDVRTGQDAYDWFTLRLQNFHPTYLVAPMIAHQLPSYSDLENTFVNKDNQISNLFNRFTSPKPTLGYPPGHVRTDFEFDFVVFLTSKDDVDYVRIQVASYKNLNRYVIHNVYIFCTDDITQEDKENILMSSHIDFTSKIQFIDLSILISHVNSKTLDIAKLLVSKFVNSECYVVIPVTCSFILNTDQSAFISKNLPINNEIVSDKLSKEYEKCVEYFGTVRLFGNYSIPDVTNMMTFITDDVVSFLASIKEKFDTFIFNNDLHPLYLCITYLSSKKRFALFFQKKNYIGIDLLTADVEFLNHQKHPDGFFVQHAYFMADIASAKNATLEIKKDLVNVYSNKISQEAGDLLSNLLQENEYIK